MNDIFISYAHEDKERVRALASALESRNWSVWWDSAIRTGEKFSQAIETALVNARCVIVVWSRHSVQSDWVQAEASEARQRGVLVPIILDDARPPLVFRQLQTADFTGWEGSVESVQFEQLAQDITSHMAASSLSTHSGLKSVITNRISSSAKTGIVRRFASRRFMLLTALALLIVGGGAGGLIYQQRQAELTLAINLTRAAIESREELVKLYSAQRRYWWGFLEESGGDALLQRSVLLAIESMRRWPSVDAEKVLYDDLVLLTRPIAELEYDGSNAVTLVMSPDGKYLATTGRKNMVYIWGTTNWQKIQRLRHEDVVRVLTFSPDSQILATGTSDGIARLWNVTDGEEQLRMANIKRVWDLDFSPDGSRLAAAGSDGNAYIWSVADGNELHHIKHPLARVGRVLYSPSGKQLVTLNGAYYGEKDSAVRLWDSETTKLIATVFTDNVTDIAFNPDGRYLAFSPADRKDSNVYLWNTTTMKEVARLEHDSGLASLAFSPDGKYLAATDNGGATRLWTFPDGDEIFRVHHRDRMLSVAFSADSAYLVTGSQDGSARVWTVPAGDAVARLNNPGNINAVLFTLDGKYVVAASNSGRARVWSLMYSDPLVEACKRLTRNLTVEEWQKYLGDIPYRKTCLNQF